MPPGPFRAGIGRTTHHLKTLTNYAQWRRFYAAQVGAARRPYLFAAFALFRRSQKILAWLPPTGGMGVSTDQTQKLSSCV